MMPNQAQAQAQTLVGFEIFVQHNKLSAMAFSSPLKLPAAGRQNSALSSKDDGSKVYLWTKEDN
jgi:hypothetical protein